MKNFHCAQCNNTVHFENESCLVCNSQLGYLSRRFEMAAYRNGPPQGYIACANAEQIGCNWLVEDGNGNSLCYACRLTVAVPNLDSPSNKQHWRRLEAAKRYFLFGVMRLGLPVISRKEDPQYGLAFRLLAEWPGAPGRAVMTGHKNGMITIDAAEASNSEREARRDALDEPLRTLVGHYRHESGHYYWNLLVNKGDRKEESRRIFGDERRDYGEALKAYYANGPRADWQSDHISAYASSHPWEDFAESWAHYLHITDSLETAISYGIAVEGAQMTAMADQSFDDMIKAWIPLTVSVNALNRAMGQPDLYPFVLTQTVIGKLRFINELVRAR